jgi:tetratricopeptide (TPR) repeat protein
MGNPPSKSSCSRRLRLASYACSLLTQFAPSFTEPIHEIAANISHFRQRRSTLPRYHPDRPTCAYRLARSLYDRYQLVNQKDDLDKSILYVTESLLLSPLSWLAHGPMILEVLSQLALSISNRSKMSKEPEDAIYAAKYLRHLRDPAHTPFAFQRQPLTALLVEILEFQMELDASDVVQTLEEMVVLTNELLTSDPSSKNSTCASTCFTRAVERKLLELSPDRLLDQIIECLRLARMHKPQLREVHFYLARCLYIRYENTLNDELDEAVSIMDEMIASSSPGDEFLAPCQKFVAGLAMVRSMVDRHPEDSEEAIYRARAFLSSSSVEDPLYHNWSQVLEQAGKNRFKYFGPIDGVEASSSRDPLLPPLPVRADVTQKTRPLDELLDGIHNHSITDIEEAIELGRSILASSDPSDLQSSHEFSKILYGAFQRTKNIKYLNESIHTLRQLLARRPPTFLRYWMTLGLVGSLLARSGISREHHTQDLHEMVELWPQFLNDGSRWLSLPHRFHCACIWALYAQDTRHPSTSAAYETALSLMQDIAPFSPTLQLQHAALAKLPAYAHEMPLGYASCQVEWGQLEQAIETLERGRAILWSEMRHLRTSIDQLLDAYPELGHKLAVLNRDLEELTKSIAPSHKISMDDVVADDLRAGDQFGSLLLRQRALLKERDKLISQIQALPGFDRFLTFPLFDTLRSAASSGPVIIVNHSKRRSDILILLHNASPSLIPTPNDFYHRASALKDKLLTVRVKDGLDSSKYDETLASVLAELYELIGKPVIDRLRTLQVPDQSRVWWCPTSVLCSLPLHAMGPIPSDDGELRYFLDLYVCSYTPSLSALIQSHTRDSGSHSSGRPSVLLVAQMDPSLPTVGARSKSSGRSILRSQVSSPEPRHPQRSSMASNNTSLFTLRAMAPSSQGNHLRPDSNFMETSALPYSKSCARISPPPNSHFSLLVTRPR